MLNHLKWTVIVKSIFQNIFIVIFFIIKFLLSYFVIFILLSLLLPYYLIYRLCLLLKKKKTIKSLWPALIIISVVFAVIPASIYNYFANEGIKSIYKDEIIGTLEKRPTEIEFDTTKRYMNFHWFGTGQISFETNFLYKLALNLLISEQAEKIRINKGWGSKDYIVYTLERKKTCPDVTFGDTFLDFDVKPEIDNILASGHCLTATPNAPWSPSVKYTFSTLKYSKPLLSIFSTNSIVKRIEIQKYLQNEWHVVHRVFETKTFNLTIPLLLNPPPMAEYLIDNRTGQIFIPSVQKFGYINQIGIFKDVLHYDTINFTK